MHRAVVLEAKCLRHCEATGEISLTCKMLTLKQRAWDLLGSPGVVLVLLQDLGLSHENRIGHPCLWLRERLFTGSV